MNPKKTDEPVRKIRVVIVDDHKLFSQGLVALLNSEPDLVVVGEAYNGLKAVDMVLELLPNIVLMDISLPGLSGMEATRKIVAEAPAVKVLVISMHCNREYVKKMMSVGASGYISKEGNIHELLRAIRAVAEGKAYLCPRIAGIMIEDYTRSRHEPAGPHMTGREREVLQLIAEGINTRNIAARLNISPKTVETHRRQIMRKLGIFNVAELTKFAVREGLTTLEC